MPEYSITELAEQLDTAAQNHQPIQPFSESLGMTSVEDAYAIQAHWTQMREARGEKVIGRKIGLTSLAIQQQLGVSEPDYGNLWESSHYATIDHRAEVPAGDFVQPRLEGEIAFLIGRPLEGGHITPQEVLAATDAMALVVEIVASRIADWRIKLVDTIADNASYGGFVLGTWDSSLRIADLRLMGMTISKNGAAGAEGLGAAAMGHPALSVAWLANKLSYFGVSLQPGDVVLSGGITKMLPVAAGDVFNITLTGQPSLTIRFV
ncbi:MAG TPA: fumarylacetoacetate hydrolase family protein [Aggregatilineales bacterium]|nr:fumarylacetoacetate hydrolase family protein [Aggregatilineales bacterium]